MNTVKMEAVSPDHYRIIGDMTFETVKQLCGEKKKLFAEPGEKVLIDLGDVARADSAGVACLLEFIRRAKSHNKEITFENIPSQLQSLIRVSGLEKLVLI